LEAAFALLCAVLLPWPALCEGSENHLRPRARKCAINVSRLAVQLVLSLGVTVWDLLYVAITIVVFALFILLVKGVERIER
jgi:hypothetical protein